ncbi:antibiotic biosynthesis monooxygenase [Vibrio natriegens]|uniref:antibiotic biosynthesis monooxygenase n=1 Tax=Vibrio natriegens TaxID=691 RepID=UPI000803E5D0|nr:antibiotic biosynthesis monooxygenase [Vibrio natriegens]ANQ29356.1 antibiotic biosynthesis monooxygenase [Vibrio natriegens]
MDNNTPSKPTIHRSQGRTIMIRHVVCEHLRNQYETWLRQIISAAAEFEGHQGVHVCRPPDGHDTFEIAVRFSSKEQAESWLASDIRKELISEIQAVLGAEEQVEIKSGIDFWFTPPTSKAKQPTRWKQWLITTAVIWPLTMLVPFVLTPVFNQFPALKTQGIQHGIVSAITVGLVVYLIMPKVVNLVKSWLFH